MVGPAPPADSMLPPVLGLYVNTSPMTLENAPPEPDPPPLLLDAKVIGGGGGGANTGEAGAAALCAFREWQRSKGVLDFKQSLDMCQLF